MIETIGDFELISDRTQVMQSTRNSELIFKWFKKLQPYNPTWQAMQDYTDSRTSESPDQVWLLQHTPVFTQGKTGKAEHVLNPGGIPVVQTDRGGQVTYHGPGQLIAYLLIDLRRKGFTVRDIVSKIEQAVINVLSSYGVDAAAKPDAPGVYTGNKKIASLGLRVRRGCTFHGLAFNVDMDISPFLRINPCGYQGLEMVQLKDFCPNVDFKEVARGLEIELSKQLLSV